MTPAVRDSAGDVAYIAERLGAAYYGGDPEWPNWLEDLRAACRTLDEADRHTDDRTHER